MAISEIYVSFYMISAETNQWRSPLLENPYEDSKLMEIQKHSYEDFELMYRLVSLDPISKIKTYWDLSQKLMGNKTSFLI